MGEGAVFGAALWALSDEVAVPAFHLSKGPQEYPLRTHAMALASHLVYSVRTPAEIYYADELRRIHEAAEDFELSLLFTRVTPEGWPRPPSRLNKDDLQALAPAVTSSGTAYVCGPTSFVEAAADLLLDVGFSASRIRTERFGPTGG